VLLATAAALSAALAAALLAFASAPAATLATALTLISATLISALLAFASATVRLPSGLSAWHYVVSGVSSKGRCTSAGSSTTTNPADNAAILVRKMRI
jgi:hypothetical protein